MANGNGTQTQVTITPDPPPRLPPGATLVSGQVPMALPPGATLVSPGESGHPVTTFDPDAFMASRRAAKSGWTPVEEHAAPPNGWTPVTITPDAQQNPLMNRYSQPFQGIQEFAAGSTNEQQFLQRFPQAKLIKSYRSPMDFPVNTESPETRTARESKEAVKGMGEAGAIFGGALVPALLPEAGVVGGAFAAGAGAGGGAVAGQTLAGGNPLEKENLKQSGGAALATTTGGLAIGGAASLLSKLLAPEAGEAASVGWQKINNTLGVKPSQIRIGPQATEIEQAATNPGRTLAKLGVDADKLAAMTPIERQATIAPHLNYAGQAIRGAIDDATDAGTTLDIGKSTMNVLKQIKSPQMQQQAVEALRTIQHELGIEDVRQVTPTVAKDFRDALKYGARFNTGGDLSSLGSLRANLYRAASRDLEAAVPNLDKLNEAYSDLKGASDAARNAVAKSMVAAPPPTTAEKAGMLVRRYGPGVIAGGLGAGGGALGTYRLLRDMAGSQ
jgi:hypothetical protein